MTDSAAAGGRNNPIGVFDSGVGGLSVLRELRRQLPAEQLLYLADSAYAPYGERAEELVRSRAATLTGFLVGRNVKAVVVACNTVTSLAIDRLRDRFSIPFVGMEPAVKPARMTTVSGVVGVLATSHTLSSAKFWQLVNTHCAGITVLAQPCPRLVRQIENGEHRTPETQQIVEEYIRPLLAQGADTIVLGCSHFAFVTELIQAAAGPDVHLIEPAEPVAREARRRLQSMEVLAPDEGEGTEEFLTTGEASSVRAIFEQLWGKPVTPKQVSLD